MYEIIGGVLFLILAVVHSTLGETGILKPLLAAEWEVQDVPRWAMERILRFAWHITSIAWLGIAAVLFDLSPPLSFSLVALLSSVMVFVMLRGHLAWPLFLLAGLALAITEFGVAETLPMTIGMATSFVLVLAALLHVYWALGETTLASSAYPKERMKKPRPLAALVVAVALATYAALVATNALETGPAMVECGVITGVAILMLRAIGDGHYIGFTKQVRDTPCSRLDDAYFTPLAFALALGAGATLLI